ncbi:porin [Alcanivorax sp. JB21]|uniref:porin n=1 Tax=Alcanivorax limicola TaxID=2874102 RepID=UPI001CBBCB92|nr:porin [Alcanivorax limicola]MBZ2189847.1 porin [Alcanivorax limicola]
MNKKLLAIAVGAIVAMPVAAMADITVYGRANIALDYLDDGADYSELNVSSNSSRLGFRGQREIGDLTAIFQIEQQIDFNQGSTEFSGRDTFAGFRGNFGMFRVGQFDSPFKRARGPADLFNAQVGDMRNLTRVGQARFDERNPNTLHYQTPSFDGLQFNIAYSVHEETENGDDAKEDGISASVTYKNGGFDSALAYETFGENTGRGERNAVRLAVAYQLTDPLKLVAFYQMVDYKDDVQVVDDRLDSDTFGAGAEFKLTSQTALRGMYLTRTTDEDDYDSDLVAVGVEHRLDSAVRVYANYAMMMNDDNIALTPWQQGRTVRAGAVAGEDASGLSVGFRYDF